MSALTGLAPAAENVPNLPEMVKASKGYLKLPKANKGLPPGRGRGAPESTQIKRRRTKCRPEAE
jgi:hypothetical protein